MNKLTPFLMFDGRAEEAINFYLSVFADAELLEIKKYGPEGGAFAGKVERAVLTIEGQTLRFFDSPVKHEFTFTPAISFFLDCDSESRIEAYYAGLGDGGTILMPLDAYPFSAKFGWLADKFGVSWQLNLEADGGEK